MTQAVAVPDVKQFQKFRIGFDPRDKQRVFALWDEIFTSQKWTEGKPQLAIIESGDQQLPWMPKQVRSATRAEFRALLWDSIVRGAQGILYFPFAFSPRFTFDNTSADIEKEMMIQNKRMADIGDVLITPIDPPSVGLDVGGNLEGTWRVVGNKKYFVVLNLSDMLTYITGLRFQSLTSPLPSSNTGVPVAPGVP